MSVPVAADNLTSLAIVGDIEPVTLTVADKPSVATIIVPIVPFETLKSIAVRLAEVKSCPVIVN